MHACMHATQVKLAACRKGRLYLVGGWSGSAQQAHLARAVVAIWKAGVWQDIALMVLPCYVRAALTWQQGLVPPMRREAKRP